MTRQPIVRSGRWAVVPILLIQVVALVVLDPRFSFPLNDDWPWIESARELATHGRVAIPDFAAMTLVGHTAYGALWCLPFGFSFTAVHLATASLWLASAIGAFWLLRELEVPPFWSAMGAALVVFNPVTICLAMGFMTDVPFLAASTLALAAYVRATRTRSARWAWAGATLAVWALLIRQIGLAMPLGAGICWLAQRPDDRPGGRGWLAPVLLPLAVYGAFLVWYLGVRGPTIQWGAMYLVGLPTALWQVPGRAFIMLMYTGLFVSPLTLATLVSANPPWAQPGKRRVWLAAAVGVAAGMVVAYVGWRARLPFVGNYLNGPGLGPYTLRDIGVLGYDHPLAWPKTAWLVLTVLAWIGATYVVVVLVELLRTEGAAGVRPMCARPWAIVVLSAILTAGAFALLNTMYDRYLVLLILPCVWMGMHTRTTQHASALICLAALVVWAGLGVLGTRTYLAWNRARWDLIDVWVSAPSRYVRHEPPVPPDQVDGGLEFGLRYLYEARKHDPSPPPGASCPWIVDDRFVVAFAKLPGYQVVGQVRFQAPLARGRPVVLMLRRRTPATRPDVHKE